MVDDERRRRARARLPADDDAEQRLLGRLPQGRRPVCRIHRRRRTSRPGKRVWHFQAVHHGVWDYDLPAAPTLLDITVDGRRIKAIAQVSKQAFTYVFDRVTGKPVWPIEERPVPPSDIPGEELSPTQPFPTRPPAFDRQGITENDLIDFTPQLRAEAQGDPDALSLRPALHAAVALQGGRHARHDLRARHQRRRELERIGRRSGNRLSLRAVEDAAGDDDADAAARGPKAWPSVAPIDGTPLPYVPNGKIGPPSMHPAQAGAADRSAGAAAASSRRTRRMTAYNLNTGDIAWQVPTGPGQDGIRNHPALAGVTLAASRRPGRPGRTAGDEDAADLRTDCRRPDGPTAAAGWSPTTRRPARCSARWRCPARRSARR